MKTTQNLTDAYDPMAGTLVRTAMQCAARGCDGCLVCRPAGAAQVVQERHKTAGGAGATPDSFARADAVPDPWALPEVAKFRNSESSSPDAASGLNVNILALDLGTKTGFALRRRDGRIAHGTQDFTPRKSWSEGQKWARYRAWLIETIREGQVHQVVYELVIRHEVKGRPLWDAAHAYGAFQAITHMVCDSFNVDAIGVNLATVKKSFTGSGRAKKADMIAEANARGFRPDSDNDADALAILHWAVAQERKA